MDMEQAQIADQELLINLLRGYIECDKCNKYHDPSTMCTMIKYIVGIDFNIVITCPPCGEELIDSDKYWKQS